MNISTCRKPVHVFLEHKLPSATGEKIRREPLTGMESCLEYYNIRLVERFRCGSGANIVYHFVAPDAECVRYVARRNPAGFDTLWLASGEAYEEKAARNSQPIYVAIYNRRISPGAPLRQRVFVSESGHRLLTFCALAESASEADETFAVRREGTDSEIEWQYDTWRDCG